MSKQNSNLIKHQLTPAEVRIIDWIRRNSNGGDWTGTIRFVSGPDLYQLADHRPAGRLRNNDEK